MKKVWPWKIKNRICVESSLRSISAVVLDTISVNKFISCAYSLNLLCVLKLQFICFFASYKVKLFYICNFSFVFSKYRIDYLYDETSRWNGCLTTSSLKIVRFLIERCKSIVSGDKKSTSLQITSLSHHTAHDIIRICIKIYIKKREIAKNVSFSSRFFSCCKINLWLITALSSGHF